MAEVIKILGQKDSAATTNETLYTVPGSTSAVVSSVAVCNPDTSDHTIRIYTVKNGESAGAANILYYDVVVPSKETLMCTVGITLATGDFIVVWASAAHICFQAFGSEVT